MTVDRFHKNSVPFEKNFRTLSRFLPIVVRSITIMPRLEFGSFVCLMLYFRFRSG